MILAAELVAAFGLGASLALLLPRTRALMAMASLGPTLFLLMEALSGASISLETLLLSVPVAVSLGGGFGIGSRQRARLAQRAP